MGNPIPPRMLQTSLIVLRVCGQSHNPAAFLGSTVSFSPSTIMLKYSMHVQLNL